MTNRNPVPGTPDVRVIAAILYLVNGVARGSLLSRHWRLSDTLNTLEQDFLLLRDATLEQAGAASDQTSLFAPELLVRRDSILLAMEPRSGVERPGWAATQRTAKEQTTVVVDAGPFVVVGQASLPPGVPLLQYAHDPHNLFMPVTGATVRLAPDAGLRWPGLRPGGGGGMETPFLLIARRHIHTMALTAGAAFTERPSLVPEPAAAAPAPPSAAGPPTPVETLHPGPPASPVTPPPPPPSPVRSAEVEEVVALMLDSTAFRHASREMLTKLVHGWFAAGLIDVRAFDAGATIYDEGESGAALYLVGKGSVGLVRRGSGASPLRESIGRGGTFGELAVLGQTERVETARAVGAVQLVALHRDGVRQIMTASPLVARAVLALAQGRRGALP